MYVWMTLSAAVRTASLGCGEKKCFYFGPLCILGYVGYIWGPVVILL